MSIKISVIIPAYNAASTIADTLRSLLAQTFSDWEAIVVNDGSSDNTEDVVKEFIKQDQRICLINQKNKGASGARNTGLQIAHYDWLLFLDSDDWIFSQHLEKLSSKLNADPSLDVVYCGWTYALPDGEYVFSSLPETWGDLFLHFAQGCVSIVHTFIVRKTLVDTFGPFDSAMRSCEDWALWQRIARSTARFGVVNEVLAVYRTRPDSLTRNGYQLLKDGIQVLTWGHGPDPRSLTIHPVYPNGLPIAELTEQKLYLLCACAGYLIGGMKNPNHLFDLLDETSFSKLDAYYVAHSLFVHIFVAASQPRSEWYGLWDSRQEYLKNFLDLLEVKSGTSKLSLSAYGNFQLLLGKYAKPRDLSQFIVQKYADFVLLKRPILYFIYRVKQFIKCNLWTWILIWPQIRGLAYRIYNHLMPAKQLSTDHPIYNPQQYFENLFKDQPNPWDYTNKYEQTKYEQTLNIIPEVAKDRVLEIACAEGYFTVQLAPQVRSLLAVDVSQTALVRCQQRCATFSNVNFQCLDFVREAIPDNFDLLICSEVLYFVADRSSLASIVQKFVNAIKVGGYLVMTHSNVLVDDPNSSGFSWDHAIGGKFIGETFSRCCALNYVKELQTPLYRIQLFQRNERPCQLSKKNKPESIEIYNDLEYQYLPQEIAEGIVINKINSLPILSYTEVVLQDQTDFPDQISLVNFEKQLRYLKEAGYYSLKVEDWGYSILENYPLKDRAVVLLFKECRKSFLEYAWPLIQDYGFSATLCIYGSEVGKSKTFDPFQKNQEISLIEWPQIRKLQSQGVSFAAYSMHRQLLTSLSPQKIWYEIQKSRSILESELAISMPIFVYPYGKSNAFIEYLAGVAGYNFAITEYSGFCDQNKSFLRLPEIKIESSDTLERFIKKITPYKHL
ncbi:glycosyltransferase [Trichothermofontia sp.]